MFFRFHWIASVAIHLLLWLVFTAVISPRLRLLQPAHHAPLVIRVESEKQPGSQVVHHARKGSFSSSHYDLRPGFARDGIFIRQQTAQGDSAAEGAFGIFNEFSRELLFTESKVFAAFDALALRINGHLDYPAMLSENGVQGAATLDLYFDNDGNVDGQKSKCFGDNRLVRGLLVKATRKGVVDWFSTDAHHLRKEQFRNQHFRADFLVSYVLVPQSGMERPAPGSYVFTRRRFAGTCLSPSPGGIGLDLACAAAKAAGYVKSQVGGTYRSRYAALVDELEYFDRIELKDLS